jgi:rRNA maturation endonuclease Nob1
MPTKTTVLICNACHMVFSTPYNYKGCVQCGGPLNIRDAIEVAPSGKIKAKRVKLI